MFLFNFVFDVCIVRCWCCTQHTQVHLDDNAMNDSHRASSMSSSFRHFFCLPSHKSLLVFDPNGVYIRHSKGESNLSDSHNSTHSGRHHQVFFWSSNYQAAKTSQRKNEPSNELQKGGKLATNTHTASMTVITLYRVSRIVCLVLVAILSAATTTSGFIPRTSDIIITRSNTIQHPASVSSSSSNFVNYSSTALSGRRWNFNEGQSPWGMKINAETWNGRVAQVRGAIGSIDGWIEDVK